MNDTQERLVKCFSTVFPALSRTEILQANSESAEWDSLTIVTLFAVIEEEFAIQFLPQEVESLLSFDAFWNYVKARSAPDGTANAVQCSEANA